MAFHLHTIYSYNIQGELFQKRQYDHQSQIDYIWSYKEKVCQSPVQIHSWLFLFLFLIGNQYTILEYKYAYMADKNCFI